MKGGLSSKYVLPILFCKHDIHCPVLVFSKASFLNFVMWVTIIELDNNLKGIGLRKTAPLPWPKVFYLIGQRDLTREQGHFVHFADCNGCLSSLQLATSANSC